MSRHEDRSRSPREDRREGGRDDEERRSGRPQYGDQRGDRGERRHDDRGDRGYGDRGARSYGGDKGGDRGDRPPRRENTNTIFVRNLSYDTTEETLKDHFNDCGNITSTRIPASKDSGRPRGFAFVEFADDEGVQAALKKDGTNLDGRPIYVVVSDPSEGRGGGGRGRGGYDGGRGGGFRGGYGGRGGFERGFDRGDRERDYGGGRDYDGGRGSDRGYGGGRDRGERDYSARDRSQPY